MSNRRWASRNGVWLRPLSATTRSVPLQRSAPRQRSSTRRRWRRRRSSGARTLTSAACAMPGTSAAPNGFSDDGERSSPVTLIGCCALPAAPAESVAVSATTWRPGCAKATDSHGFSMSSTWPSIDHEYVISRPSGSVVRAPSKGTGWPVVAVSGPSMTTTGAAARAVAGTMAMLLSATSRAARDVRDRTGLRVARSGKVLRPHATAHSGRPGCGAALPVALLPRAPVAALLGGELVELDAQRGELEARHLAVDVVGDRMHAGGQRALRRGEVLDRERLQREGEVHDRRGVTLAGGEVDHAPGGQQVQPAPVGERVLLDQRPHPTGRPAGRAQRREVDLDVEVAGVGQHRAVLHPLEVLAAQDAGRAG